MKCDAKDGSVKMSTADAGWEALGSSQTEQSDFSSEIKQGGGSGWGATCTSTSGYSLSYDSSTKKLWPANSARYAAFRIKTPGGSAPAPAGGALVTCIMHRRGWSRPYGDVALSGDGALDCKAKCKGGGYKYFGMECPMTTKVHCQCSNGKDGTEKPASYCEGKGGHSHNHCVGPYKKDGWLFGDAYVGSVYLTAA